MDPRLIAGLVIFLAPCASWCADDTYVGSKVCAQCHREIYDRYMNVPMAHSMSPANQAALVREGSIPVNPKREPIKVFSARLNRWFQVFRKGMEIYQSESEVDANGQIVFTTVHRLEFAMGSGVNGQTYVVRRDEHLFEAPLSYYSRTRKWSLSPGYEFADYGFNRPIESACLGCHSGRPRPVHGRSGLYLNPPFQELAIGCENCHGPGGAHLATHGAAKSIVNPAKLSARLAEQICMNCHQGGDARVLQPGKDYSDFRPGTWLNDTLSIFRLASMTNDEDLLEHHAAMESSKCFTASGGKLSCLTCHDPHEKPPSIDAARWYRSKCLGCHSAGNCKASAQTRQERSNDCTACHMPKRNVTVISHSVLTNHRINAYAGEPLQQTQVGAVGDLIHINPRLGSSRLSPLTLLKAYGELQTKYPAVQTRYLALLDQLARDDPNTGVVQAALGMRALRTNASDSSAKAIGHLTKALELGFSSSIVCADLADALSRASRLEEAVDVLNRGISAEPYAPELYKSLTLQYISLKQYAQAKQTMTRYMELFPEDDFMRGLLARVESPGGSR
jgi:hypothetical protein